MILVADRRSEDRHDPIACVLVNRALEAVNAVSEDAKETVHDSVPLFGAQLRRELHRTLHVRRVDRMLLALACEGAARRQDFLGEVFRRVGAGVGGWRVRQWFSDSMAARIAEILSSLTRRAAFRTGGCIGKWCSTLPA